MDFKEFLVLVIGGAVLYNLWFFFYLFYNLMPLMQGLSPQQRREVRNDFLAKHFTLFYASGISAMAAGLACIILILIAIYDHYN